MFNYFVRRFLLIIPTFLIATLVVFVILQVTPGGPFEMIEMQAKMQMQQGSMHFRSFIPPVTTTGPKMASRQLHGRT